MGRKCTQTYIEVDPCAPSATSLVDVVDNNIDYSKSNIDRQNTNEFILKCTEGKGKSKMCSASLEERQKLTEKVTVKIRVQPNSTDGVFVDVRVNKYIKDSVKSIFKQIFDTVPEYYFINGKGSIHDFRETIGTGAKESAHLIGLGLDFNGNHNPYMPRDKHDCYKDGKCSIPGIIHMRDDNHPVVKIFKNHGWRWGGSFKKDIDYMHFDTY